jgi:hypothetical protein
MALLAASRPPADSTVLTVDMTIEGVKCRVYSAISQRQSRPVGVYTHGGGFICGDLDSEDTLCRAIAHAVDCIIISVDYRLGPGYKLPVMLQDTLTIYQWVWSYIEPQKDSKLTGTAPLPIGMGECLPTQGRPRRIFLDRRKRRRGSGSGRRESLRSAAGHQEVHQGCCRISTADIALG